MLDQVLNLYPYFVLLVCLSLVQERQVVCGGCSLRWMMWTLPAQSQHIAAEAYDFLYCWYPKEHEHSIIHDDNVLIKWLAHWQFSFLSCRHWVICLVAIFEWLIVTYRARWLCNTESNVCPSLVRPSLTMLRITGILTYLVKFFWEFSKMHYIAQPVWKQLLYKRATGRHQNWICEWSPLMNITP